MNKNDINDDIMHDASTMDEMEEMGYMEEMDHEVSHSLDELGKIDHQISLLTGQLEGVESHEGQRERAHRLFYATWVPYHEDMA